MNPKILVVEDDDVIRELLTDLLESEGYAVRAASDGQEALDCLPSVSPDLVISDLVMPKVDGLQLRTAARENGCPARFILMSAMRRFGPWQDAVFLPKPFEIEKLLSLVEHELAAPSPALDREQATPRGVRR